MKSSALVSFELRSASFFRNELNDATDLMINKFEDRVPGSKR